MAPYEAIAPAIAVVVTVLILCIFFPRSVYILVLATVAIPIPILALFIYVLWNASSTSATESSAPIQIDLAPTVAQQDITAAQGQTSSVIRKSKKKSKPSVKNSTSSDAHADADRKYPEIITIKTTTESQGGKLLFGARESTWSLSAPIQRIQPPSQAYSSLARAPRLSSPPTHPPRPRFSSVRNFGLKHASYEDDDRLRRFGELCEASGLTSSPTTKTAPTPDIQESSEKTSCPSPSSSSDTTSITATASEYTSSPASPTSTAFTSWPSSPIATPVKPANLFVPGTSSAPLRNLPYALVATPTSPGFPRTANSTASGRRRPSAPRIRPRPIVPYKPPTTYRQPNTKQPDEDYEMREVDDDDAMDEDPETDEDYEMQDLAIVEAQAASSGIVPMVQCVEVSFPIYPTY